MMHAMAQRSSSPPAGFTLQRLAKAVGGTGVWGLSSAVLIMHHLSFYLLFLVNVGFAVFPGVDLRAIDVGLAVIFQMSTSISNAFWPILLRVWPAGVLGC